MNRISIAIDNLSLALEYYDKIKVYRADSESGQYVEITSISTRITIIHEKEIYYYSDETGTSSHWYKTSYYNSTTTDESELSAVQQGGTEDSKIGYSFDNYSPPPNVWGKTLTADDMRYHFAWGIDMIASDELGSEVENTQLDFVVKNAMAEFERSFMIDIRKRIYKTQPSDTLTQAVEWIEGVDYTDEDDPYDFDKVKWTNYGFLQMRHRPIISIESAGLYSPWDQLMLDVKEWVRLYKKPGHVCIYPKGPYLMGKGYAGSGILMAHPNLYSNDFPQGFKIDYTTGYKTSDFVPGDLRNAIGILAAINLLNWMGDGLMAGYSSSSVSLDNLSESFSSTQSATSAYFGARIKQYIDYLKQFVKTNKYKYANIPLGFISGGG